MSMEELLKYIQRTNPDMTAGKLMEKIAECRCMTWIVLGIGNVTENKSDVYTSTKI